MKFAKSLTLTLAGAGFVVALAVAQDAGTAASRPAQDTIGVQIKNLDHESFEVRTKAMEELRAAGEKARKQLEAAKSSPSLEVRTRAETLLKELDSGTAKPEGELRPVAPEDENVRNAQRRLRTAPQFEDYDDPRAFIEALEKWMADLDRGSRLFPDFVLGGEKGGDFTFRVIEPGELDGGSISFSTTANGEMVKVQRGPEGVRVEIERRDETGKPVQEKYEAKDVEEFKQLYPDVWEKHGSMMGGIGVPVQRAFRPGWMAPLVKPAPLGPIAPPPSPIAPVPMPTGPKLGVFVSPVPPVLDHQLKLKGEGVVVDQVELASLASRMGLQPFDVLLSLDGQKIASRDDITRVLASIDPPATATAKVVREGTIVELSAQR